MISSTRPFGSLASILSFYAPVFLLSWFTPANILFGQTPADRSQWLSMAPGEYLRLIQAGNVSIQVSDALLKQKGKVGATEFKLQITYRYSYTIDTMDEQEGMQLASIQVSYQRPKFRISHTIHVQSDFSPSDPWSNRLMKHEMDHLAVSTDPRLRAIVDGVLGSTTRYEFRWEQSSPPSEKQIREEIHRSSTQRILDIEKMIQLAYDQLDDRSMQGNRKIESRGLFFRSLYRAPWLQNTGLKSFRDVSSEDMESWERSVPANKLEVHYRESWDED